MIVPDTHRPGKLMFQCSCGRCQSYAPKGVPGGVTESEVELIGWRKIDEKWMCPFCTGNTSNLYKVFGGKPGKQGE